MRNAKLAELRTQLKLRVAFYRALYRNPRTPLLARVLLWLAVAYALLPFDLIPDFVPVIGHLDDAVIIPALILLALWLVPRDVPDADWRASSLERLAFRHPAVEMPATER